MNQTFSKIKKNIHSALCNDFDLPRAMEQIISLIDITTEYIDGEKIHAKLVQNIYDKIINLLGIFGLKYKDVFYCEKSSDYDKE
jgi:cysteinyl-tRNA synthetase